MQADEGSSFCLVCEVIFFIFPIYGRILFCLNPIVLIMKKRDKFLVALLSSLLFGCGNNAGVTEGGEESASKEAHHEDEIVIDKHQVDELGIKSSKIALSVFSEVINVSGEILPAQGETKSVVAKSSGMVNFSKNAVEGAAVGKGSQICSINADGMLGGNPNVSAKITYETAKSEFERIKPLYEKKIVTASEYKAAKEAYELAENAYMGGGSSTVAVSPLSGVVTQLTVANGSYVEAGATVAIVSENRRLTMRAYLPKKYYGKIASIRTANFKLPYSDKVYSVGEMGGRKVTSDNVVAQGGYIDMAFEFNNPGGIVPGSYAEIYLLGAERKDAVVVPLSSVTEEMGYFYVYIELEKGCYEKRRIEIGGNDGSRVEVLSGLKPGETVVTEGAILVKIAANSTAVPEGHHHH